MITHSQMQIGQQVHGSHIENRLPTDRHRQLDKCQLLSVETHHLAQQCAVAHFRYLLRHNRKWRLAEGSTSLSLVSGCLPWGHVRC